MKHSAAAIDRAVLRATLLNLLPHAAVFCSHLRGRRGSVVTSYVHIVMTRARAYLRQNRNHGTELKELTRALESEGARGLHAD